MGECLARQTPVLFWTENVREIGRGVLRVSEGLLVQL